MSHTVLIALVIVAILIVLGRLTRRTTWGNRVAIVGFVTLASAALPRVLS